MQSILRVLAPLLIVALAGCGAPATSQAQLEAASSGSGAPKGKIAPQQSSMAAPADPAQFCAVYYAAFDANGDKGVTRAEFKASPLVGDQFGKPRGTVDAGNGTVSSGPAYKPTDAELESRFAALDGNGDGKLSDGELCASVNAAP